MKAAHAALLALLFLAPPACAQMGWQDAQGNAVPDTDQVKSRDGFGASLVVTSDKDWREKWDTPPETTPHFTQAKEVTEGGELVILTFVTNPALDALGQTDISCAFEINRPNGRQTVEPEQPCLKERLKGDPKNVYMTGAHLSFRTEPTDPRGTWEVRIIVKDRIRNVALPLRATFVVK